MKSKKAVALKGEPATQFEQFLVREGRRLRTKVYAVGHLPGTLVKVQAIVASVPRSKARAYAMRWERPASSEDPLTTLIVDWDEMHALQKALRSVVGNRVAPGKRGGQGIKILYRSRGGLTVGRTYLESVALGVLQIYNPSPGAYLNLLFPIEYFSQIQRLVDEASEKLQRMGAQRHRP